MACMSGCSTSPSQTKQFSSVLANLFHACMRRIITPWEQAGFEWMRKVENANADTTPSCGELPWASSRHWHQTGPIREVDHDDLGYDTPYTYREIQEVFNVLVFFNPYCFLCITMNGPRSRPEIKFFFKKLSSLTTCNHWNDGDLFAGWCWLAMPFKVFATWCNVLSTLLLR